jgi:hypothetical protein
MKTKWFNGKVKKFCRSMNSFEYNQFLNPSKEKFLTLKRDYQVPKDYSSNLEKWSKENLNYKFQNPILLSDVFILPSYLLNSGIKPQSTQLSIIGSSILNLILSSHTYQQYKDNYHGKVFNFF